MSDDVIVEEEAAQPLYDQVRQNILDAYLAANINSAKLRSNFYHSKNRETWEEQDLRRQIYYLYHILRPKINREIRNKNNPQPQYLVLLKLDNPQHYPNAEELLKYFDLLREYIEELKITRIENKKTVYANKASLMEGLGQQERPRHVKRFRRKS